MRTAMTMRAAVVGCCASAMIALAAAAGLQGLPSATDALGGFALPDGDRGRLILITSQADRERALAHTAPLIARPELLKTALCAGGRRVPVQFERRQAEAANDGRQTSRNFGTLAGSIFAVVGTKVDADTSCFLASEALLAGRRVSAVLAPDGPGPCREPARFSTLRDRPVAHCWPIARLGPNRPVVLVEFERRGKEALAAIALVDGARTIFIDFPAELGEDGHSLWRVDDEGVLSPDAIRIVCAIERDGWYALGTSWAGAEGLLLSLWIADGTDRFTKVLNDYWYQAPR